MQAIERLSSELTNACSKGCAFCYKRSGPDGATHWSPDEVVAFVEDCARHGTRAVSFGGGEPLQYPGVDAVLGALEGRLFRSVTTGGLPLLEDAQLERLVRLPPDKVHVSIHFPERSGEVRRVASQVTALGARGIKAGVNLVVARSKVEAAREAVGVLGGEGAVGSDQARPAPRGPARAAQAGALRTGLLRGDPAEIYEQNYGENGDLAGEVRDLKIAPPLDPSARTSPPPGGGSKPWWRRLFGL